MNPIRCLRRVAREISPSRRQASLMEDLSTLVSNTAGGGGTAYIVAGRPGPTTGRGPGTGTGRGGPGMGRGRGAGRAGTLGVVEAGRGGPGGKEDPPGQLAGSANTTAATKPQHRSEKTAWAFMLT